MHKSIPLNCPCEFVEITPFTPLISKCVIKVLYVSDEPNRNNTVITKEVAKQLANTLPGSPIVGYFNKETQDFEEHNRSIKISNGQLTFVDETRPYGFVDLNPKVWFQKFLDDDQFEREYLVTEGWIWTGQYPESKRIVEQGNNQSMELHKDFVSGTWAKGNNNQSKFFIINEAIISKLCTLGLEYEPCFEGATITNFNLSFSDEFKNEFFSMMNELKEIMEKGGAPVFTTYAVEIGDALWGAIYSHIEKTYPSETCDYCSSYRIEGIFEEGGQKFTVLQNVSDMKYYRLNFSLSEDNGVVFEESLQEVTKTYTPLSEPQFSADAYAQFENEYAAKKKEEEEEKKSEKEGKSEQKDTDDSEESTEDEEEKKKKNTYAQEKCSKCGKPLDECECEEEDKEKKTTYSLDQIPEYVELALNYSALVKEAEGLRATIDSLNQQISSLSEFKLAVERKDKEAMIASFSMLSEEDKFDVITNIDNYSLNDIEAKLAVICVRKKVSFGIENESTNQEPITTYNLNNTSVEEDTVPDWVKAVRATVKNMN